MIWIIILLAASYVLVNSRPGSRPGLFIVTRSASFPTTPEAIFPHINNLHKWDAWSPWAKLDPAAANRFEGPDEGPGASLTWAGNSKVGEGTMTITKSQPFESVELRLDFRKPMKATNTALFTLHAENGQTLVTWSMQGRNGFMGKLIGLVLNCESMVGKAVRAGTRQSKNLFIISTAAGCKP